MSYCLVGRLVRIARAGAGRQKLQWRGTTVCYQSTTTTQHHPQPQPQPQQHMHAQHARASALHSKLRSQFQLFLHDQELQSADDELRVQPRSEFFEMVGIHTDMIELLQLESINANSDTFQEKDEIIELRQAITAMGARCDASDARCDAADAENAVQRKEIAVLRARCDVLEKHCTDILLHVYWPLVIAQLLHCFRVFSVATLSIALDDKLLWRGNEAAPTAKNLKRRLPLSPGYLLSKQISGVGPDECEEWLNEYKSFAPWDAMYKDPRINTAHMPVCTPEFKAEVLYNMRLAHSIAAENQKEAETKEMEQHIYVCTCLYALCEPMIAQLGLDLEPQLISQMTNFMNIEPLQKSIKLVIDEPDLNKNFTAIFSNHLKEHRIKFFPKIPKL